MGKVLHASASGHFPFCLSTDPSLIWTPTNPNSQLQLGPLDLKTAMAVFWKVKSWDVFSEQDLTIIEVEDGGRDTEEKIVCNTAAFSYNLFLAPYDPIGEESIQILLPIFWPFGGGAVKIGSNYWLNVGVFFPSAGVLEEVGAVDANALHFYYEIATEVGTRYRFEIKPLEFFSFGGTYDTSTGLPL